MDNMRLFVIVFLLSMSIALNCNWKTHYGYRSRCCKNCPSDEFPKHHCNDINQTLCTKCSEKNDHCFCINELCENDECSKCSPNPRCKQGEELRRTGSFRFSYICKQCQNQTYYDEEDNMCKPMLDCRKLGLHVTFPGNKTHNARCGDQGLSNYTGHQSHHGFVVGLAIMLLVCLAMFIYLCIQRARKTNKQRKKKSEHSPTSSFVKVPSGECGCKLSTEETREMCIPFSYTNSETD